MKRLRRHHGATNFIQGVVSDLSRRQRRVLMRELKERTWRGVLVISKREQGRANRRLRVQLRARRQDPQRCLEAVVRWQRQGSTARSLSVLRGAHFRAAKGTGANICSAPTAGEMSHMGKRVFEAVERDMPISVTPEGCHLHLRRLVESAVDEELGRPLPDQDKRRERPDGGHRQVRRDVLAVTGAGQPGMRPVDHHCMFSQGVCFKIGSDGRVVSNSPSRSQCETMLKFISKDNMIAEFDCQSG